MSRPSAATRREVARCAKWRCEYCHAAESQTGQACVVDHVVPTSRGGTNELDNLCLSCGWCNSFKQAQTFGWDEVTRRRVRLFHPRRDLWNNHFRWNRSRTRIVPITSIGSSDRKTSATQSSAIGAGPRTLERRASPTPVVGWIHGENHDRQTPKTVV